MGREDGKQWWGGTIAGAVLWGFAGVDSVRHGVLGSLDGFLIVAGALLVAIPRIDAVRASFPFLGREAVEVSINAQLRQAVEAAGEASTLATNAGETAGEAAKLYERWLRELETLFAFLETGQPDRDAYARAIFRFINTRVEDISTWAGGQDEEVRAALWWWSDADGGASIVAAPRIADRATLEHVFHPGEGILGRVLADGEPVNVADAPEEVEWVRITPGRQRYRGLLCLPIVAGGRVAGVLSVDRAKAEPFSEEAVRFVRQVASLIKLAAFHAAVPSEVFSLPLPGPSEPDSPPVLDSR